ncbi:MAG: glycerol-3-phosphate responsive antiterminator [Bacillota bacterium]
MATSMRKLLQTSPIIAAVRDEHGLTAALTCPQRFLFLLSTDIGSVGEQVRKAREHGKEIFVHFDLVQGLGRDSQALRWLAETARPSGVITTRAVMVSQARSLGLATVLRTFLVDSQSAHATLEQVGKVSPDLLEVMPGIAPEGIRLLASQVSCPVIGGGLVRTMAQVRAALAAGAAGISTSAESLWRQDLTR